MLCLRCGHEWEARVPNPVRCPFCTSVLWSVPPKFRAVPRMERPEEAGARLGSNGSASVAPPVSGPSPVYTEKRDKAPEKHDALPDLDALRAIAEGKGKGPEPAGEEFVGEDALCPYRELDRDAGEWVYCSLKVHGPKVKHAPGRRESAA